MSNQTIDYGDQSLFDYRNHNFYQSNPLIVNYSDQKLQKQ